MEELTLALLMTTGNCLHLSVRLGHDSTVKLPLADARVDPSVVNNMGENSLHLSTNMGNVNTVKLLLVDGRVNPTAIAFSYQLG
jgi:ankyrin repeat protein